MISFDKAHVNKESLFILLAVTTMTSLYAFKGSPGLKPI